MKEVTRKLSIINENNVNKKRLGDIDKAHGIFVDKLLMKPSEHILIKMNFTFNIISYTTIISCFFGIIV